MIGTGDIQVSLELQNEKFLRELRETLASIEAAVAKMAQAQEVVFTRRSRKAAREFRMTWRQAFHSMKEAFKHPLRTMQDELDRFLKEDEKKGKKFEAGWWKRFGAVALGFTVAYRAMNAFEAGMRRLVDTFHQAIRESGMLASMQAKLAFWYKIHEKSTLSFAKAYEKAGANIKALADASITSLSSIEELSTGLDELAQGGLIVKKSMMPALASLVDYTAMVAQTTGSTTRQIRQELQSLMEGQVRTTNIVVRSFIKWGILTDEELEKLKRMEGAGEIIEKLMLQVHARMSEVTKILVRADVDRALQYWEKSLRRMISLSVELASGGRGLNLFAEAFAESAEKFREGMSEDFLKRNVVLLQMLRDILKMFISSFEFGVRGAGYLAVAIKNLSKPMKDVLKKLEGIIRLYALLAGAKVAAAAVRALSGAFRVLAFPLKTILTMLNSVVGRILFLPSLVPAVIALVKTLQKPTPIFEKHQELLKKYQEEVRATKDELEGLQEMYARVSPQSSYAAFYKKKIKEMKAHLEELKKLVKEEEEATSFKVLLKYIKEHYPEQFRAAYGAVIDRIKPYVKEARSRIVELLTSLDVELPALGKAGEGLRSIFGERISAAALEEAQRVEDEMTDAIQKATMSAYEYQRWVLNKTVERYMNMKGATQETLSLIMKYWVVMLKKIDKAEKDSEAQRKERLESLKDTYIDKFNELTMERSEYELWALEREKAAALKSAEGQKEAVDAIEKYFNAKRQKMLEEHKAAANHLITLSRRTAEAMETNFSDFFFELMTGKLKTFHDYVVAVLESIARACSDLLGQLATSVIFGKGGLLEHVVGKGGGGEIKTYKAHRGGVIGKEPLPQTTVPENIFRFAPKLHAGLRSDEYPAILQRGETVLPRGASPIERVQIVNNTMFEPKVEETRGAYGGRDITVIIGEIAANDVRRGGALYHSLRSVFGMSPVLTGR